MDTIHLDAHDRNVFIETYDDASAFDRGTHAAPATYEDALPFDYDPHAETPTHDRTSPSEDLPSTPRKFIGSCLPPWPPEIQCKFPLLSPPIPYLTKETWSPPHTPNPMHSSIEPAHATTLPTQETSTSYSSLKHGLHDDPGLIVPILICIFFFIVVLGWFCYPIYHTLKKARKRSSNAGVQCVSTTTRRQSQNDDVDVELMGIDDPPPAYVQRDPRIPTIVVVAC